MWWCVAILLAASEPPHAHAHMVLSYEHLEPDVLPWAEVGTGHRLDPQVAQVRLAMFVVETARDLAAQRNDSAPRRQPRSHPRTQTPDLAAKVKGEVYKKVLQQTLAHTRRNYKQLVSSAASSFVKEAMLREWLGFVTESDIALRVLYSLKDEEQSSLQNEKRKMKTRNSHESESYYKREKLEDKPVLTHSNTRRKTSGQDLISLLMGTLLEISGSSNSSTSNRSRRSDQGLMYLPIGGTTKVQCPTAADAAGVSIAQMAFLSICLTVFNVIVNINNNINNNNNNNNINSDNNLSNNNAELSLNVNNAGQVNVMLPPPIPGRKRRAVPFRAKWQDEVKASGLDISRWAESETSQQALEHILLDIDKKQGVETSALADGGEALVKEWNRKSESKMVRNELRTAKATANRKEAAIADNVQGSAEPTANSNSADARTRPAFDAVTEPSVGEDFRLPTPVPGALGSGDRSSEAHTSSRACEKGGRKGVASGFLRAVREWALEAPLLPLQCRGLLWCRGLKEASTKNVWLHVLASFAAHQRTRDRQALTLRQFTAAALADNTCEQLFPTCKQTAVP